MKLFVTFISTYNKILKIDDRELGYQVVSFKGILTGNFTEYIFRINYRKFIVILKKRNRGFIGSIQQYYRKITGSLQNICINRLRME